MNHLRQIALRAGRSVSQQQIRNGSSYKPVTMNDMPAPSGSWSENYSAKQGRYNLILVVGVASALAAIGYGYQTGAFYMNLPPEMKNKK